MCTYWHVRSSESGDGGGQAILRRRQNKHASEGLPVVAGVLLIAAATAREVAVTPEAIDEPGGESADIEERVPVLDCLTPPESKLFVLKDAAGILDRVSRMALRSEAGIESTLTESGRISAPRDSGLTVKDGFNDCTPLTYVRADPAEE